MKLKRLILSTLLMTTLVGHAYIPASAFNLNPEVQDTEIATDSDTEDLRTQGMFGSEQDAQRAFQQLLDWDFKGFAKNFDFSTQLDKAYFCSGKNEDTYNDLILFCEYNNGGNHVEWGVFRDYVSEYLHEHGYDTYEPTAIELDEAIAYAMEKFLER